MAQEARRIRRITKTHARNFRSLEDIAVELGPITVLVGPNASGKSNFVDVLRFVAEALRNGLDAAITTRHGLSALRRWSAAGRPRDIDVDLALETPSFSGQYAFTVRSTRGGLYRVEREYALVTQKQARRLVEFERHRGRLVKPKVELVGSFEPTSLALPTLSRGPLGRGLSFQMSLDLRSLSNFLSQMRFYHIFPNMLREPQKPLNPRPLDEYGANLISAVREMKSRGRLFPHLQEALRKVIPSVRDLRTSQMAGFLFLELQHTGVGSDGRGPWFHLSQESDGTLRLLGLMVALFQTPSPTLIAIEEPELNLHPGALVVLADLLKEASQRSQILITTHSPDLIDRLPVESLRAVEMVDGSTQISPVAEHQLKAVKEQLFSPGEIMRMEGLQRTTTGH